MEVSVKTERQILAWVSGKLSHFYVPSTVETGGGQMRIKVKWYAYISRLDLRRRLFGK